MTSTKLLLSSIQSLYNQRDTDNLADFVIESKDGEKLNVHSLILFSRRSEFFKNLLSNEFR